MKPTAASSSPKRPYTRPRSATTPAPANPRHTSADSSAWPSGCGAIRLTDSMYAAAPTAASAAHSSAGPSVASNREREPSRDRPRAGAAGTDGVGRSAGSLIPAG